MLQCWTFFVDIKVFASLLPLPPPNPPKKKSVKDASVLDIFRKRSRRSLLSFSPLCLTRPAPYPSACHFPLSLRSHKTYFKQGRRKRGPVRDCIVCYPPKKGQGFKRTGASYYCRELDCIACDPPKKGQGFKRTGEHPTTAESWVALPATLPRKTDRVSRGPGHPTTAESWIALPATLPRKDRVSRGQGHPTTQRVGLHCLRPSQERWTGFQEDGGILLL